jgi:hypothetical protein
MEAAKGFAYLVIAISLVFFAVRSKTWSWPLFWWILLLTVVIGGGGVWAGIVLSGIVDPANRGPGVVVDLAVILVAVALITLIAIRISRRYRPPST